MKKINKSSIIKISLLTIIIIFFCGSIVIPFITLLKKAFYNGDNFIGLKNFKLVIMNGDLGKACTNSIIISLIVTIITLLIAFIFAYGIERTNIKGKRFFQILSLMPLFAPTMAYGIALVFIFGRKGILTTVFLKLFNKGHISFNIYGMIGIIIAEIIYVFPSVCLIIMGGIRNIDYSFYEVAETMGTSSIKQFMTVTLPNMKNSLINATFTAFVLCFTDFGIPKVIGGRCDTLALKFFQRVVGQNQINMGAVVAVMLLAPCFVYYIIYRNINKCQYDYKNIAPYKINKNICRDILFTIYNVIISIIIISIFITLIIASIIKDWPYNLSITFKYYHVSSVGISLIDVYKNTLIVALLTAIFGTIIVFITSYIVERYKGLNKVRYLLRCVANLPMAIPGMVIGLSYILFFNNENNIFNFIYGTFIILILSNIVHFFSVPFLTISQHLSMINKEFENVSECMGIPWYINLFKVIIPISIVPIVKSFTYYFMNSMITISAVSFLYNNKTKLASIEIMNKMDAGDVATAAAIVITIVAINIVLKLVFNLIERKIKVTI